MSDQRCPLCLLMIGNGDDHACVGNTVTSWWELVNAKSMERPTRCNGCHEIYDHEKGHNCGDVEMSKTTERKDEFSSPLVITRGYESLAQILVDALNQAQNGKGSERHGNDKPFLEQPMMKITEVVGQGFCVGQAMKKLEESMRMGTDAAIRERLGAINYIAGSIIALQRKSKGV